MEVIDFQFEVVEGSVTESLTFNDLDLVVDALHLGGGDGEEEVGSTKKFIFADGGR